MPWPLMASVFANMPGCSGEKVAFRSAKGTLRRRKKSPAGASRVSPITRSTAQRDNSRIMRGDRLG
jgi:hypothetical protein